MVRKNPDAFLPLKSNWLHILVSLVDGEQHGYGIMLALLERSGGWSRTALMARFASTGPN